MKKIVLEPSTNTHSIEGDVKLIQKLDELNGMVLEANENCLVLHGEHGLIVTEEKNIIKLTQQELNPLSGQLTNAFD
jgi:hypothetical protein